MQSDSDEGSNGDEGQLDQDAKQRRRAYTLRGRRKWSELARYDRTGMLDSKLEAALLAAATDKMREFCLTEWLEI